METEQRASDQLIRQQQNWEQWVLTHGMWAAGTVEAGAGAEGEGLKRKREDDMAALEADLAPQAGMPGTLTKLVTHTH